MASDEADKARRRAAVADQVAQHLRGVLAQHQDAAFLGHVAEAFGIPGHYLHSTTTTNAGAYPAEDVRRASRPAVRTFVCQGCGTAAVILHGTRMKCPCGADTAAELLPP